MRSSAPARPTHPWPQPALAVWAVLGATGATLVAVGWSQVGRETVYEDQVGGMSIAVAGLTVAGVGAIWMLLAARRAVQVRRVALLGDLRSLPVGVGVSSPVAEGRASQDLVGGEVLRHFHRAGCRMAQARNWSAASRREHEQAGRVPCGVCRP